MLLERDLTGVGLFAGDCEGDFFLIGDSEVLERERDLPLEWERDFDLFKRGLGVLEFDFRLEREWFLRPPD